ncbi:hypothetical protein OMR07_15390 [Methylobacterium organophilum]|nr:hypothetical protein [Methylobacterium organophilum]
MARSSRSWSGSAAGLEGLLGDPLDARLEEVGLRDDREVARRVGAGVQGHDHVGALIGIDPPRPARDPAADIGEQRPEGRLDLRRRVEDVDAAGLRVVLADAVEGDQPVSVQPAELEPAVEQHPVPAQGRVLAEEPGRAGGAGEGRVAGAVEGMLGEEPRTRGVVQPEGDLEREELEDPEPQALAVEALVVEPQQPVLRDQDHPLARDRAFFEVPVQCLEGRRVQARPLVREVEEQRGAPGAEVLGIPRFEEVEAPVRLREAEAHEIEDRQAEDVVRRAGLGGDGDPLAQPAESRRQEVPGLAPGNEQDLGRDWPG